MNPVLIQALVRHILTAIAGGFAVKYGIDGATMDALVGGAAAAAGVGWSIYDKKRASQTVE
ncbi:MAG: hypothetical protein RL156_1695 [Bacteroidota bacterium]|jgi:O-antigen/teichoic acid export membrane protein